MEDVLDKRSKNNKNNLLVMFSITCSEYKQLNNSKDLVFLKHRTQKRSIQILKKSHFSNTEVQLS